MRAFPVLVVRTINVISIIFFKGSSRRKGILSEYLEFVELDWENFMQYVKTHWLSLQQCCDKEVKKYPALKSMFLSRVEKTAYEDSLTKIHLLFYIACLLYLQIIIYFCREVAP